MGPFSALRNFGKRKRGGSGTSEQPLPSTHTSLQTPTTRMDSCTSDAGANDQDTEYSDNASSSQFKGVRNDDERLNAREDKGKGKGPALTPIDDVPFGDALFSDVPFDYVPPKHSLPARRDTLILPSPPLRSSPAAHVNQSHNCVSNCKSKDKIKKRAHSDSALSAKNLKSEHRERIDDRMCEPYAGPSDWRKRPYRYQRRVIQREQRAPTVPPEVAVEYARNGRGHHKHCRCFKKWNGLKYRKSGVKLLWLKFEKKSQKWFEDRLHFLPFF
ncbi:hypothetical protein NA57DRAFT_58545 [Rhizodiscina lignyota]|uniref:Uncharacterized protein n=1 Tax=Rhizodiscina lignyota TaxID=1504668 RepID=A0A9P4I9P8_9PEZI|nr:hypothetical protein NA57DRAFT_58545 [Rhizodiscina lignyota]